MGLFSKILGKQRQGIPGRDAGATQARPTQQQQAPRPTLIQGGPAYFTPEGYRPPMQPQQAFMPTDTMGDPIGDMFRRQLPPVRGPSLPKMPPQKDPRDDQIFVPPPIDRDREPMPVGGPVRPIDMPMPMPNPDGTYGDPNQLITGGPAPIPPGMGGGFGSIFDNLREFMENNPDRVNKGGGMLGKTDPNEGTIPIGFGSYGPGGFPDVGFPDVGGGLPMPPMAPPMMPPSFERIEEDPRMPLEEPIAMPRNPEMVADIQRRMAPPPMMPTQEPISPPYEMGVLKESPGLPDPDMSGKFTDISDNFVDKDPFLEDRGFGPGITRTPDFMEEMKNRGPMDSKPPMDIAPPMAPPRRSIAPPSFEREPREMPREEPIQAPLPPAQIEQIKQVLPQLPQEQLMEILPQLPPEAIQELPEELIRKIMPMMPEPMMPEPMMPEPMMPRMQMPGPIATPTPRSKRPSLPMMPMMGGRGRR